MNLNSYSNILISKWLNILTVILFCKVFLIVVLGTAGPDYKAADVEESSWLVLVIRQDAAFGGHQTLDITKSIMWGCF